MDIKSISSLVKGNWISIIKWIGIIILILIGGFLIFQNQKFQKELERTVRDNEVRYKNITKSLQRAETKQGNEGDIERFSKTYQIDINKIKDDLENLDARLTGLGVSVSKIEGQIKTDLPSTYTKKIIHINENPQIICKADGRPIDIHGYTGTKETIVPEYSNGLKLGSVSFSAARENPWDYNLSDLRFQTNIALGETDNGTSVLYTELLVQNQSLQPGETFRIEGVESRLLQIEQPVEFQAWDPRLFLLVGIGLGVHPNIQFSGSAGIGLSIMSYGNFRFLGLGAQADFSERSFMGSFFPFLYNIGDPLPLLTNLYVAPYISFSHRSSIGVGISLGVSL